MIREHWFWWLLTVAVVAWYSSVTVYVAIKGALDIKHMLRRLRERPPESPANQSSRE